MYREAKSVGRWLKHGWHVTVAYVVGFAVMLALTGWHPSPKRASAPGAAPAAVSIPYPVQPVLLAAPELRDYHSRASSSG